MVLSQTLHAVPDWVRLLCSVTANLPLTARGTTQFSPLTLEGITMEGSRREKTDDLGAVAHWERITVFAHAFPPLLSAGSLN